MRIRLSVGLLHLTLSVWWPACSSACGMNAHWWSCVLGLLCMPAEVILSTETVSQNPSSIAYMKVNSSATITCSTSLSDALGLYLNRQFHGKKNIVYLSLNKGQVTKDTTSDEFAGRIQAIPDKHITNGYGFTLQLSQMRLDDTDLYYCQWSHFDLKTAKEEYLSSNGTVIIVRDYGAEEPCTEQVVDGMLIILIVTVLSVTFSIAIAALIWKHRQFKKRNFRPNRHLPPSLPNRPEHVYPQHQQMHQQPYMTTSENFDYRAIL